MGAYGTCHVDVRNLPQADRPLFAAMSAKSDTQADGCPSDCFRPLSCHQSGENR